MWWSIVISCAFYIASSAEEHVTVQTEIGTLKGYKLKSTEGKEIHAFIGVPFAKPPVGDRRFKRPEPLEASTSEIETLKKKPMCPQIPMILGGLVLPNDFNDDDCLYMNIFASAEPSTESKPVMVYFYGGFYQWGDINLGIYDGVEFAAETDSVIVMPAYRVNMFGFLNSSGPSAPGNAGLFDQLMALKFIQKNIKAFGGNPDLVTISGQSAGAISASVHTSSPASKGLFRRAILLSGAAPTLAFFQESNGQNLLFTMANFLDCFDGNLTITEQYDKMAACLAKIDKDVLLKQLKSLDGGQTLGFGPGRDGEILAGDPKRPTEFEYNVEDVIVSTTATDGELILKQVIGLEPAIEDLARNSGADVAVRIALKSMFGIPTADALKIYAEYFGPTDAQDNFDLVLKKAPSIVTDVSFTCPAKFYANAVEKVNGGKTNIYRSVLDGPRSRAFVDTIGPGPATHTDDVMFFLGIALNKNMDRPWEPVVLDALKYTLGNYTNEDRKFTKDLLASVKSFMINGKPKIPGSTEDWPLFSEAKPKVLHLAPQQVQVVEKDVSDKCHLWAPYILAGDVQDVYDAPTTTTSTKKPTHKKATTVDINGKKYSKSFKTSRNLESHGTAIFSSMIVVLVGCLVSGIFTHH